MMRREDKHRKLRIAVRMTLILSLATPLLAGCGALPGRSAEEEVTSQAPALPNPASQYCAEQGYELEMRQETEGTVGYCLFPDGSECEEWAFYRGECGPGGEAEAATGMPNPASVHCEEQGAKLEIRTEAGGEVGYCLFPDGSECEEWAFYRGECGPGEAAGAAGKITARMLVEPNALAGPGPTHLMWSPQGATLAYVAPQDGGEDVLWLYEATTGDKRVLLDPVGHADSIEVTSAQWSPQGDALLLTGEKALWLLDVDTGGLKSLAEGEAKTAVAFAPSGDMVSYVQDNDLYTIRIADNQIQRLTTDGSDTVFNGTLDWVYTEEFATRVAQPAYAWSPDGRWLLYLRLDDEGVQQHPVTDFRPVPPTVSYTRYPTAGSPNPAASLHLIDVRAAGHALAIPLPQDAEYILPFFTWTPDSREALYLIENRAHTVLDLKAWNPATGVGRTVLRETDPHWINEYLYVAPEFLGDGGQFLWLSERDGFMHLYLYSREGEVIRQLTEGEWLIDSLPWDVLKPGRPVQIITPGRPVHIDPSGDWAYFSTTQVSPLERQLYRLNIESGRLERLTQEPGFHFAALSSDGQYLVEQFSNVDTPPVTTILKADGSRVEVLGKCAGPSLDLPKVSRAFLNVKAHDGEDLYAQIVKPEGFDPDRKYPVVVHWYGGPSLQLVSNRYGTTNIFNHIERDVMYTQEGFIVWRLDNRGSFGRGHAFETPIAGHLGPAALDDQLAGIEYLKTLPYVDADRIGADGKSFGGFLTMYALIHAPDLLYAGVDGSGPTDWRYYDTVYTERYMGTPQKNPAGYEATALITRVDQLQIRPLIIHGLADTNVHLQNSVNLIEAMMHIDKPLDFVPLPNSDHHYGGDGLVAVLAESARYFAQHLGDRQ
jgi:dipeptidyl-peptidase-4